MAAFTRSSSAVPPGSAAFFLPCAAARAGGATSVAVAAYLLAEGFFHDRLADAGADHVTAPLGDDDAVLAVILSRLTTA